MGMFDSIRFSQPMPDGRGFDWLQTKDLENDLVYYEVSADNKLLKVATTGYGTVDYLNPAEPVDFTGVMECYALVAEHRIGYYKAKFLDGNLLSLTHTGIW